MKKLLEKFEGLNWSFIVISLMITLVCVAGALVFILEFKDSEVPPPPKYSTQWEESEKIPAKTDVVHTSDQVNNGHIYYRTETSAPPVE